MGGEAFAHLRSTRSQPHKPAHLELELTGYDYRRIQEAELTPPNQGPRPPDPLRDILEVGKKNLDWMAMINAARPADQQLRMTSPETTRAYPIEAPGESNRRIISRQNEEIKNSLPAPMKTVLYEGAPMTPLLPASEAEYVDKAREVNRLYENASRWLLQEPSLAYYAQEIHQDIRGYYLLEREEGRSAKLLGYQSLGASEQGRLQGALVGQCMNSKKSRNTCRQEFQTSLQRHASALPFYEAYVTTSKKVYDAFFDIQNARPDVTWTSSNAEIMMVPFTDPLVTDVRDFIKINVEEEWKWPGFQLLVNFVSTFSPSTTHVVFEEGATPHVDDLGGSIITMDANVPLHDYGAQWTIRHEYGHTLGFPDCYVEFYDSEAGIMINYQIDISNLMCSRRGKFQEIHFNELKKVYLR